MNQEPFASQFRPDTLDEFVGQKHLVGKDGAIRKFMEFEKMPSMIFWGPPGTGKTTLAYIISQDLRYDFYKLQAVTAGKKRLLEVMTIAKQNHEYNKKTILFLDEIHRWNKAQQDALLPFVEKGLITLIGATTENPSFSINNALLSRTRVFVFNQHSEEEIEAKLKEISKTEVAEVSIYTDAIKLIAQLANGDLRAAYNILEMSLALLESQDSTPKKNKPRLTKKIILSATQRKVYYDRNGEEHYNIISAVHKSLRSSNGDAATYWVVRMLQGGEDPLYVARRLLRFASEDIGNADPQAVILANTVFETCMKLGMPECEVHLVQLARYLAKAPKDNSAYVAENGAKADVHKHGNLPVPLHLRNAPTNLMKEVGYGKGYQYDHDLPSKKSDQQCMPDKLKDRKYTL